MVRKFKRRPLFIEAAQFNGWSDVESIRKWAKSGNVFYVPAGAVHEHRTTDEVDWEHGALVNNTAPEYLVVNTPDGEQRAEVGWWIVVSEQGDAYVVDPQTFDEVYEDASPTNTNPIDYFQSADLAATSRPVSAAR